MACTPPVTAAGVAREGYARLEVALPPLANVHCGPDRHGQFPQRIWAVEGCAGIGRHRPAPGRRRRDRPGRTGETVRPARVFATGQGRKTDPIDAHSVAVVGLRSQDLRHVTADDATVALLVDRRDELRPGPHRGRRAPAPAAARPDPGRREEVPHPGPGGLPAPDHATAGRHRRPHPPPVGHRARRRPDHYRREARASQQAARRPAARCATSTGSDPSALRGCSVTSATSTDSHRRPRRFLERPHAPGRILRRSTRPPAIPGRQPAHQPSNAHHGRRPTAPRHPRAAPTTGDAWRRARPRWKPSAPSNGDCPMWSTAR